MERDFMGLNSKDSVTVIKEEAAEGCKDSGQQVQWPLGNTFDPSNKRQLGENQKNFNHNMEGGSHFSMTAYPFHQNAHSVHLPREVKVLRGSNLGVSLSTDNPFFKTQFPVAGQNFMAASTKPHFLGGIPITAPHSILPSIGAMAGSTEPWLNLKTSQAPTQLTIFYGDTVNVFDDISLEKAHAIMFLAGISKQPRHPVQAPISKPVAEDILYVNQPVDTPPCSGLSSPISVSSHPVGQSGGGLTKNDGSAKTSGGSTTPVNKVEAPKMVISRGHAAAATTMIQSAVPQARKASLARFLEKRKERVMGSAPYNHLTKKTADCATPGSNGVGLSGSSGLGSRSISTGKDNNSH